MKSIHEILGTEESAQLVGLLMGLVGSVFGIVLSAAVMTGTRFETTCCETIGVVWGMMLGFLIIGGFFYLFTKKILKEEEDREALRGVIK